MNMIPDPIEQGEARAEAAYDAMIQPDGRFRCLCGNLFDPECEGGFLSPDPYSPPFCPACCEKAFAEFERLQRKEPDVIQAPEGDG